MDGSLKNNRKGINQWLDGPMFTFAEGGKIDKLIQLVVRCYRILLVLSYIIIAIFAVIKTNEFVTTISAQYQIPHPIFVTSQDYGHNAIEKPTGIFMNTKGKLEVNQNGVVVTITLTDRDGFYVDPESANPSLYIFGTRPSGLPGVVETESRCLSEPADAVSFSYDWLPPGEYIAAAYYHEPSGLFRGVTQEFQIR